MNEDANEWTAALIVVVWLWCLLALVPSFFARRRRVERVLHVTGTVAVGLFVVFWVSLLAGDSDEVGYVVVPFAVVALLAWATRRYGVASLAFWGAVGVLVVGGAAYMAFYGPAPLAVIAAGIALVREEEARGS